MASDGQIASVGLNLGGNHIITQRSSHEIDYWTQLYRDRGLYSQSIQDGHELLTWTTMWPEPAEFIQIVPKISTIARLEEIENPFDSGYSDYLKIFMSLLSRKILPNGRRVGISCSMSLYPYNFRPIESLKDVIMTLDQHTADSFLTVPMQRGSSRFTNISAQDAINQMENNPDKRFKEWPLPTWVILSHLLTNLERYRGQEVYFGCPGDEVSLFDQQFDHVPIVKLTYYSAGAFIQISCIKKDAKNNRHYGFGSGFCLRNRF